jgi:lipid II:glycine glycyltransferase (peptidoglycan interpeptide bridge formation enzyme)
MIKANRAELLLSYLDESKLVGASLFLDTGETTTYGVGVYERSLFEKPLSHAPIFMAMLRAKERGQRRFVIGDVPPAKSPQDKEFSIGWFKSGFTGNLTVGLDWTYRLQESETSDSLDTAAAQHATVSEK